MFIVLLTPTVDTPIYHDDLTVTSAMLSILGEREQSHLWWLMSYVLRYTVMCIITNDGPY